MTPVYLSLTTIPTNQPNYRPTDRPTDRPTYLPLPDLQTQESLHTASPRPPQTSSKPRNRNIRPQTSSKPRNHYVRLGIPAHGPYSQTHLPDRVVSNHFELTYLPACLPTYLPTYLLLTHLQPPTSSLCLSLGCAHLVSVFASSS